MAEEIEKVGVMLQQIIAQKQALQMQLAEIENAIEEIKKAQGKVYKMVGNFLLETDKNEALRELEEKKELLKLRLEALTKQEEKLREKIKSQVS